jgi:hypothetical protein
MIRIKTRFIEHGSSAQVYTIQSYGKWVTLVQYNGKVLNESYDLEANTLLEAGQIHLQECIKIRGLYEKDS